MRQPALRTGEVNFRAADRSEYGLATGNIGLLVTRLKQYETEKGFGAGDWKTQAKRALVRKQTDDERKAKAAEYAVQWRAKRTPDDKAAAQTRKWQAQREKRKAWSPEKKAEWKAKRAEYQRVWWAKLTPEEREKFQNNRNEKRKNERARARGV